jgi:hypothetical protein
MKETDRYLTGANVVPQSSGVDRECAAARWEFIKAVRQLVPGCFEKLRDDVNPVFERILTGAKQALPDRAALLSQPNAIASFAEQSIRDKRIEMLVKMLVNKESLGIEPGPLVDADSLRRELKTRFEQSMLREVSSNTEMASALSNWAGEFNLDEEWIREGALETLLKWHHFPDLRKDLDVTGFHKPVADTMEIPQDVDVFRFRFGFDYDCHYRLPERSRGHRGQVEARALPRRP